MRQLVRMITVPFDFWRDPRAAIRDWSTRRTWPGRNELARMEPAALNDYLASVGIEAKVDEAAPGARAEAV